jgi:hypothetical protein
MIFSETRGMNEVKTRWRMLLFRFAIGLMAVASASYLCGIVVVNALESVDAKIRAGAWIFLIGSALSLLAFILSMFGYGLKRIGLGAVCLVSLPFWYGFTLY